MFVQYDQGQLSSLRDIAFEMSEIAIWLPLLCLNPPTEGFPWDDLRKIFRGCQRMAKVPNGEELLKLRQLKR